MTFSIYKKLLFLFYPTDLVNTKTTIPLRVWVNSTRYINIPRWFTSWYLYISTAIHLPFGNSSILLMIWMSSQNSMYNQRAPRSNQFPWKAVHQGWRIRDQLKIYQTNYPYVTQSIEHTWLKQKKIGSANFCLLTGYWTTIEHTWLVCSSKSNNLWWFQWWISLVANMSITFFCESQEFPVIDTQDYIRRLSRQPQERLIASWKTVYSWFQCSFRGFSMHKQHKHL